MRSGVGIARSLHQEAARFTQRAIGEFFSGQFIAFIIDAGTAMEHLAKARVADHAPLHLFKKHDRDTFSDTERRVVCGGGEPPPLWDELGPIVERISGLRTIGAGEALRLAARKFIPNGVDLAAALRVSTARNAAVHAAESPPLSTVDAIAVDWLAVMSAMGASRHPGELWGNWWSVATPEHLTTQRSLEADADVRIRKAINSSAAFGTSSTRRSWIMLDQGTTSCECPACRCHAVITVARTADFPEHLQREDPDVESHVLDCLYCGLILCGPQIEYSLHLYGRRPSRQPGSAPVLHIRDFVAPADSRIGEDETW